METLGVLYLKNKYKFGRNKRGKEKFLVVTHKDERFLVASSVAKQYKTNVYVTIRPLQQEKYGFQKYPNAQIVRIIGSVCSVTNKYEALFYKHYFSTKKNIFNYLDTTSSYEDYTKMYTLTIDPIGSKDLDDALSIVDKTIYIHIADPTSVVDISTVNMKRYTSIYNAHRVVNMYNDEIGNDKCSLLEGQCRRTISFKYDTQTKTITGGILALIKVNKNYSYCSKEKDLRQLLELLNLYDLHEVIEYLMKLVNQYVGQKLADCNVGIFRNYKCKEPELLLEKAEHINYAVKRFLKIIKGNCAVYSLTPAAHDYLNITKYCHFTSPLRRFADSLNHLLWKKHILKLDCTVPQISKELINDINNFEKRCKKLKHDVNKLVIQERIGINLDEKVGYIIDIPENYLVVYIPDYMLTLVVKFYAKSFASLYERKQKNGIVYVVHKQKSKSTEYKLYDKVNLVLYNVDDGQRKNLVVKLS